MCLGAPEDACRTACGHVFCEPCLRRCLKAQRPWNRGRCPLCRGPVSLYDTTTLAGPALEQPAVSTILGQVYVQAPRSKGREASERGVGQVKLRSVQGISLLCHVRALSCGRLLLRAGLNEVVWRTV